MSSMEMIKQVVEEKEAEINGRSYKMLNIPHRKRLKIFGYFTDVQDQIEIGKMKFLGDSEWEQVEKVIFDYVTYNSDALSNLPKHFDEHPGDYLILVTTMLAAFSYPLFPEGLTS